MSKKSKSPGSYRRRIKRAVWLASLLLCITSADLWVYSCVRPITIRRFAGHVQALLVIDWGIMVLHRDVVPDRTFPASAFGSWDFSNESRENNITPTLPPPNSFLGFGRYEQVNPSPSGKKESSIAVAIPLWFIVMITAIIPAIRAARDYRVERRLRKGTCRKCGYDLTGNTSGVCPECGLPLAIESDDRYP